jgi:mannose-6-phosphate isomerase-like protein (cupin superfamily)
MHGARVIRLADTETISLGPASNYRPIVGDDAGTTPVRTGIQTCLTGYEVPPHCHPYVEIIHVLDGELEFWMESAQNDTVVLRRGDTIEIHPGAGHGFRAKGDETARLLGIHVSPKRIVEYSLGMKVDARGYRTEA